MLSLQEETALRRQNKAKMAKCRGCRYLEQTEAGTYLYCNYLEKMGRMRPCPIENCTEKVLRNPGKRKQGRAWRIKTGALIVAALASMALTLWLAPEDTDCFTAPESSTVTAERDADAECIESRELALARRAGQPAPRVKPVAEARVYLGRYWITGYDICVKCCGKTDGITASGVKATVGRTVAAPKGFDFGTRLYIDGLGERVVEDRGGAIKGNKIDVLCEDHAGCYAITGFYDVWQIVEVEP